MCAHGCVGRSRREKGGKAGAIGLTSGLARSPTDTYSDADAFLACRTDGSADLQGRDFVIFRLANFSLPLAFVTTTHFALIYRWMMAMGRRASFSPLSLLPFASARPWEREGERERESVNE